MGSRFQQLVGDAKSRIREVAATEAEERHRAGALLIDVRETEDFHQGHAKGAIHLSRGVIELKIEELAPDLATPIVCYCGGGSRSALVVDNLQKMGYLNTVSMTGGLKSWKQHGLATE